MWPNRTNERVATSFRRTNRSPFTVTLGHTLSQNWKILIFLVIFGYFWLFLVNLVSHTILKVRFFLGHPVHSLHRLRSRSKRPRSHCLSTGHLLPYMWSSFHPLDPSRYLSSFSSILPPLSIIQRLLLGWHRRIQYSRLAKTLLVLQTPPAKLAFRSPWWSWVDTILRHFKTFMAILVI